MDVVDWESILDDLPELEVADFFQDGIIPPDSFADHPSPNSSMSQLENLLMTDFDNGEGIASPESDYDKLLEEILVQPLPQSEESLTPSDKDRVDPLTPEEVPHEPVSKKQIR